MGLLSTSVQNVTIPKPDFVQLVGQLPTGTVAGCKWCKKTIFWNGSFWNHVDGDQHNCERGYSGGPHDITVVGHQDVEVGKTLFRGRPIMAKAPVYLCTACGNQKVAQLFSGRWFPDLGYGCPAKVATPAKPATPTEDQAARKGTD